MKQGSLQPKSGIIAGALYVVLALGALIGLVQYFRFASLLYLLGYGAFAALLFLKRRDVLLLIGPGLMVLAGLVNLFQRGAFAEYDWYSGEYRFNLLLTLRTLLVFAALVLLLAMTACACVDGLAGYREKAKKLWFLPAALTAAGSILQAILLFVDMVRVVIQNFLKKPVISTVFKADE